jgi:hypothetical protein
MTAKARPAVVCCSAGSLVLGIFGIYFLLVAYASYRAEDFVTATETQNFAVKGTCVESVSDDIVTDLGIGDASWGSSDYAKKSEKLSRVLATQAHSLYYLHKTNPVGNVTAVATSVMAATLGHDKHQQISRSMAYQVLSLLDDDGFTVPSSCASIYTGAVSTPYDTSNPPGGTKFELPDIVKLDSEVTEATTLALDATTFGQLLYACEKQFHFGRTGPHADTYGIPLLNEVPGPNWYPWGNTSGFNESSSWQTKSRMFLGFRYGWSLWAYTPNMIGITYMAIDAALMLLTETTIKARFEEMVTIGQTREEIEEAQLHVTASYLRERFVRGTFGLVAILNSTLWMVLAVWSTWGIWSPRLGRPLCEQGTDADLTFMNFGYPKSQGGWKPDWDVYILEAFVLAAQYIIFFAIPLSRSIRAGQGSSEGDRLSPALAPYRPANVSRRERWIRVTSAAASGGSYVFAIILAAVSIIVGNAYVGSVFGNAWARAVAMETVDGKALPWNEKMIAEYIYDMNLGTLLSMLAVGLIFGVVATRYMFDAATCASWQVFAVWIVLGIGGFAFPVIFYGIDYFTDSSTHVADCKIFDDGSSNFGLEKGACDVRFWTFLVGILIMAGIVVLLTFFGLMDVINIGRADKYRMKVPDFSFFKSLGRPNNKLNGFADGANSAARIGGDNYATVHVEGTGASADKRYASKDEGFFNFKTSAADDTKRRLLSSSPPPPTGDALPPATKSAMRFTLNPASIVPAAGR